MIKLKSLLNEKKLSYDEYEHLRNTLIKTANELADFAEIIAKGFEQNNQGSDAVKKEMKKAEKFREMAKYTQKNL